MTKTFHAICESQRITV